MDATYMELTIRLMLALLLGGAIGKIGRAHV